MRLEKTTDSRKTDFQRATCWSASIFEFDTMRFQKFQNFWKCFRGRGDCLASEGRVAKLGPSSPMSLKAEPCERWPSALRACRPTHSPVARLRRAPSLIRPSACRLVRRLRWAPRSMGPLVWTAPTASECQNEVVCTHSREPSMVKVARIGIDTSKSVFQLHGVDEKQQQIGRAHV